MGIRVFFGGWGEVENIYLFLSSRGKGLAGGGGRWLWDVLRDWWKGGEMCVRDESKCFDDRKWKEE